MGFTFSKIGKNILTQSFSLSFFTIFFVNNHLTPPTTASDTDYARYSKQKKKTVVATSVTTTAIDCISNSTIRSVG